jgi:hypothetical protein
MISSKQQVRSYLKDYLALKFSSINFNKQYFDCPFKSEHTSEVTYPTANISKNNILFCSHPSHIKIGDIFQIVRKVEPDMKDMDDGDIQQYLVDLFKIQTDDHIDILLNKYVEYGFDLVPVAKNEKNPIEKAWQTKSHKNKQEWLEWIDSGLNIGIKTGKLSNILVIDIDADNIPESLKNILPATLIQKTNKGWHFVYKFDESISKTSFDYEGVHIDIQGEGGQIVVAPSEINGQKRNWNFHTIEEITSELKAFILKNSKPQTKVETLISDDTIGKIKGLEGNCNNTFVKVAGQFRKFMSLDQVEKSLYFINDTMLDSPMQHKALRSMIREIEKYHEADREELSKQILTRLDKVDEVTIRDLVYSLRQEQKDIEDTLRDLIDKELIYRKGSKYKVFQKADWKESFITESKLIDFKMPYFDQYATFRNGDMIVIGAKTGIGKSHLALNIIQQLVQQGQFPHYISSEPGNRFSKIAMTLGLQEGQFRWCNHYRPEQIELEDNVITIIDWLLPENYAETDKLYQRFAQQLDKHKGVCIIFCQLNREGEFMAKNMIDWFASLSCKYCHSSTKDKQGNTISDNNNTFFQTEKIRESKCGKQYITIPTYYDSETKLLTLRT